jgi:hypothetical protein
MPAPMQTASSSDVSKRFGFFYDEAMTHPVGVDRNGATRIVMLSLPEYQRLALLDQISISSADMPDEDFKALRDAQVSEESITLNALMD